MTNEKIFERHFKEGMNNKDFEAFKKSHPTLLKVILKSMDEEKNIRRLFIGKVAFEIGSERTIVLLQESKQAFKK